MRIKLRLKPKPTPKPSGVLIVRRVKLKPCELTVGMRVSYCLGKYRKVVTGNIIEMRRVPITGKDATKQMYSTRARVGTRWVNINQLFREVDTTLILE